MERTGTGLRGSPGPDAVHRLDRGPLKGRRKQRRQTQRCLCPLASPLALPRLPAYPGQPSQLTYLLARGVEPYDPPTTVLVQRSEPQGVSTVLSSTDFFQSKRNRRVILEQVDSFQLRDKYLFATTTRVRGAGQGAGERYRGGDAIPSSCSSCVRSALTSPPRWLSRLGVRR